MEENIWHILPIGDSDEHEESSMCKCKPTVKEEEGGGILIVHNSFDGREGLEQAIEILNKP